MSILDLVPGDRVIVDGSRLNGAARQDGELLARYVTVRGDGLVIIISPETDIRGIEAWAPTDAVRSTSGRIRNTPEVGNDG